MNDRLRRSVVVELTGGLAWEEQQRLAELGTFADFEYLTAAISDELKRQSLKIERTRRADEFAAAATSACPECGTEVPVETDCRLPLIDHNHSAARPTCRT